MTESDRAIIELKQIVVGNGTRKGSILGRLDDIEEKIERIIENHSENCFFKQWQEQQDKKRNFRIGDIANVIQFFMLCLIIYQMFKGG